MPPSMTSFQPGTQFTLPGSCKSDSPLRFSASRRIAGLSSPAAFKAQRSCLPSRYTWKRKAYVTSLSLLLRPVTTVRWREATESTRRDSTTIGRSTQFAISKSSSPDTWESPTANPLWLMAGVLLPKCSAITRRWCNTCLTNVHSNSDI